VLGGLTRWRDALSVFQQAHGSMTIEELTSSVGKLRLVGQGAEAEVFEWRDGRVLKLLRARGATERWPAKSRHLKPRTQPACEYREPTSRS
jgi:hypothetical protein